MALHIQNVRIQGPLVRATEDEVTALEEKLWITFPAGYREYVTQLGEGVLGGDWVRIYPPWRIEKELVAWRKRIAKYWFWENSSQLLPKDRALESVILGDTLNGDELIFHPTRPRKLLVLPRDTQNALVAGADLWEAVEWMCQSGKLTEAFPERDFTPFDSRQQSASSANTEAVDPEGESLDEIIALAKAWAERHGVLELAKKDLGKKGQIRKGATAQLLSEGLYFTGSMIDCRLGYVAEFQVNDLSTGQEKGIYRWFTMEGARGDSYETK